MRTKLTLSGEVVRRKPGPSSRGGESPAARVHRKRMQKNYRITNRAKLSAQHSEYYERNRAEILFADKLYKALMRIRRAVIASGGVPFDG